MKRLAGIVDADASLMGREAVRQAVTSSFLDEAVSVRQASAGKLGGGGGGEGLGGIILFFVRLSLSIDQIERSKKGSHVLRAFVLDSLARGGGGRR